jgi:hypothetical protein
MINIKKLGKDQFTDKLGKPGLVCVIQERFLDIESHPAFVGTNGLQTLPGCLKSVKA